jgi:hypothetical protein
MLDINGSDAQQAQLKTAQEALLKAAAGLNPHAMLPSAYINGVLIACRLNALIDVVGLGDAHFQIAFDNALLAQMQKLTGTITEQLAKPQIQIAQAH